jgi:cell division protein FtsI (penicillin-binding protein 3)
VKRKVTVEEASRVRDLNLKGIYFQRETKRFNPKGDLAAHILGYVGLDDKGLAGLEYGMDDIIRGRPDACSWRRTRDESRFNRPSGPGYREKTLP